MTLCDRPSHTQFTPDDIRYHGIFDIYECASSKCTFCVNKELTVKTLEPIQKIHSLSLMRLARGPHDGPVASGI
jgi:hypothetical protein